MKFTRSLSLAAAVLAVTLFFAIAASAQMVGNYRPLARKDADARAAAVFAVRAQGKKENQIIRLKSVLNAEGQLVQGMNYKLCLKVTVGSRRKAGEIMTVRTVVYRDLKRKYSLSSWTQEPCGS